MNLSRIEFENYAWRGIRLEGRMPHPTEKEPYEFSIGWHNYRKMFEVIDYLHFESGPSHGTRYYYRTFDEVKKHFSKYPTNLDSFDEEVDNFIAEKVMEEI